MARPKTTAFATIALTAASEREKTHRSGAKAEVRMQKEEPNILHPSLSIFQTFPVLAPRKGRIYDRACGSGGVFVQSVKLVEAHCGTARLGLSLN